jgi:hypothetical protein
LIEEKEKEKEKDSIKRLFFTTSEIKMENKTQHMDIPNDDELQLSLHVRQSVGVPRPSLWTTTVSHSFERSCRTGWG